MFLKDLCFSEQAVLQKEAFFSLDIISSSAMDFFEPISVSFTSGVRARDVQSTNPRKSVLCVVHMLDVRGKDKIAQKLCW